NALLQGIAPVLAVGAAVPLAQVLANWAGRLVLDAGIADGMEARRTMPDARVALGMKARRAVLVTDAADGMVARRAAAHADVPAVLPVPPAAAASARRRRQDLPGSRGDRNELPDRGERIDRGGPDRQRTVGVVEVTPGGAIP